jgi:hypothetical protein
MARGYRAREDGLFEVETPGLGFVPVHWGEDQLRAQGLEPLAPPSGRLAFFGDTPQSAAPAAGGQAHEAAPAVRADVEPGPAGWSEDEAMDAVRRVAEGGGQKDMQDALVRHISGPPGAHSRPEERGGSRFEQLTKLSEKVANKEEPQKGPKTEAYRPGASSGQSSGAGAPRYATTKARDVKAAWRVDKGPQLDPENEEFRSEAEIDTRLNMQERADREEERALRNVEEYEKRVLAPQARQISTDELKLDRMRQEYARRQKEIDDERAAVDKLEVDPNRIFAEKGAWASVLAGISILAGGALQGLQGRGSNPGLDAVNAAIDRDVQLQKEKYARRREGLREKETAYERLMNTYGNPEMAEAELRNRQASLAEAWAKRHAMQSGAEDVQANLQQAFNERDLARVEERRQLDQAFGDRISEQWQHVPAQTYQVGGQRALKPEARERMVRIDGKTGFVVAGNARDKVQESVNNFDHMDQMLAEYEALASNPDLGPNDRKRAAEALKERLGATMAVAQGQGAMSDGERENVAKGLGSPEDMVNITDAKARIETTRRFFRTKRDGIVSSQVYQDPDATTPWQGAAPRSVRPDQ